MFGDFFNPMAYGPTRSSPYGYDTPFYRSEPSYWGRTGRPQPTLYERTPYDPFGGNRSWDWEDDRKPAPPRQTTHPSTRTEDADRVHRRAAPPSQRQSLSDDDVDERRSVNDDHVVPEGPAKRWHALSEELVTDGEGVYRIVFSRRYPYEPVGYKFVGPLRADLKARFAKAFDTGSTRTTSQRAPERERQSSIIDLSGQPKTSVNNKKIIPVNRKTAAAPEDPVVQHARQVERFRLTRAAKAIQAAFRQHRQRRLAEQTAAALKIQRAFRRYHAARQEAAVRVLQRVMRGFLARSLAKAWRTQLQALVNLEGELDMLKERKGGSVFRQPFLGPNGRPRYAALEYEELLTKLLIKVDGVQSLNHDGIRMRRKRLTGAINAELARFDDFRHGKLAPPVEEATPTPLASVAQTEDASDSAHDDAVNAMSADDLPASTDGRFRTSEASEVAGGSLVCAVPEAKTSIVSDATGMELDEGPSLETGPISVPNVEHPRHPYGALPDLPHIAATASDGDDQGGLVDEDSSEANSGTPTEVADDVWDPPAIGS